MKEDVEKTYANRVTTDLKQDNVRWVLTVPAIWNDSAKQFMRFAAEQVNIMVDPTSALS
ncbi:hypothetical protein DPMN_056696 [Dreissena polymorpha]|uniref:Uncharacterized protein n=1 Tax=Dreissena polymorpha TaxID=45954 RepID=A0A9D4HTF8_DREPO|nr:hypothetical protein DPMN_056696 [Dreissena polymorpha]